MPFFGFLSKQVDVPLIDVSGIVLHRLIEKIPSSTVIGVGFVPAGFVAGTPVVGTMELVAGTIAPPEPEPSLVGLSMALETTADNLYFKFQLG